MKNKKIFLTLIISFFSIFLINQLALASAIVPYSDAPEKSPAEAKYKRGDYELNDVLKIGTNIVKLIFGVVGSLTLLFFVYGGVMFLISAGSSDKVQKAKTILINSTIGLIIVFASYLIVDFTIKAFGVNKNWSEQEPLTDNRYRR